MRVAVVATFDATRGTEVAAFEEAVAQWAAAHRIVVTKADLAGADAVASASSAIATINPLAEVVATVDRARAVSAVFAPLQASLPLRDIGSDRIAAHPRIALCMVRPTGDVAYADLADWLDNLAGALGERLLRLKGLVRVTESERPLLIESVGTVFSPPRPLNVVDGAPSSFLVVIGRDVSHDELLPIAPEGLFEMSSWQTPDPLSRPDRPAIKAEWVV